MDGKHHDMNLAGYLSGELDVGWEHFVRRGSVSECSMVAIALSAFPLARLEIPLPGMRKERGKGEKVIHRWHLYTAQMQVGISVSPRRPKTGHRGEGPNLRLICTVTTAYSDTRYIPRRLPYRDVSRPLSTSMPNLPLPTCSPPRSMSFTHPLPRLSSRVLDSHSTRYCARCVTGVSRSKATKCRRVCRAYTLGSSAVVG